MCDTTPHDQHAQDTILQGAHHSVIKQVKNDLCKNLGVKEGEGDCAFTAIGILVSVYGTSSNSHVYLYTSNHMGSCGFSLLMGHTQSKVHMCKYTAKKITNGGKRNFYIVPRPVS